MSGVNIDPTHGTYPLTHWAGTLVILVDDADVESPSDREGRIQFR